MESKKIDLAQGFGHVKGYAEFAAGKPRVCSEHVLYIYSRNNYLLISYIEHLVYRICPLLMASLGKIRLPIPKHWLEWGIPMYPFFSTSQNVPLPSRDPAGSPGAAHINSQ